MVGLNGGPQWWASMVGLNGGSHGCQIVNAVSNLVM